MAGEATKRRRERFARLLRDTPDVSDRAAGREMAVHHTTIARDRAWLAQREEVHRPPAPPLANGRALKAGDTSERKRAPLRQAHSDALRLDYSGIDDRRCWLLADALAAIDLSIDWLDKQEGVVRNEHGDVFAVCDRLEKARATAWRLLRELEEEARASRSSPAGLEAYLTENYGDDDAATEPEQGGDR